MSSDEWMKNSIKGKIAECIVEEMLKELGYTVFPFGYETVLPFLAQKKLGKTDFYAKLIRDLPDFIIIDNKNDVYPVEVKYRKDGEIPRNYFVEIKDAEELIWNSEGSEFQEILNNTSTWQECLVIIVSPKEPCFQVYYPGKWLKRQLSIKEDAVPLGDCAFPFCLQRETIEEMDEVISKYSVYVKKLAKVDLL